MSRTRHLLALLGVALLCGCAQARPDPVVVADVPVSLPQPEPLVLAPVHWRVLTPANTASAFATQSLASGEPMFLGLSSEDYKALAVNMIDIDRYMAQQQAVIDGMRRIMDARASPALPVAKPITPTK